MQIYNIFEVKMIVKSRGDLRDASKVISCNEQVINIYKKIYH